MVKFILLFLEKEPCFPLGSQSQQPPIVGTVLGWVQWHDEGTAPLPWAEHQPATPVLFGQSQTPAQLHFGIHRHLHSSTWGLSRVSHSTTIPYSITIYCSIMVTNADYVLRGMKDLLIQNRDVRIITWFACTPPANLILVSYTLCLYFHIVQNLNETMSLFWPLVLICWWKLIFKASRLQIISIFEDWTCHFSC